MKNKDRGINRKKQREAAKKEALRVKDAAFFATVKYSLLGFGLLFVSFLLLYIGQEYSPGVFLLSTERTTVCFLPCVGIWLSNRYIKKARDSSQSGSILFRHNLERWYIAQTIFAALVSLMWALDFLLSL